MGKGSDRGVFSKRLIGLTRSVMVGSGVFVFTIGGIFVEERVFRYFSVLKGELVELLLF